MHISGLLCQPVVQKNRQITKVNVIIAIKVSSAALATAVLRPVWPPRVGSKLSGLSLRIICSTISGVIGSMYVLSAISGSVIIVAGLLFMRITLKPSFLRTLQACTPE